MHTRTKLAQQRRSMWRDGGYGISIAMGYVTGLIVGNLAGWRLTPTWAGYIIAFALGGLAVSMYQWLANRKSHPQLP